MDRTEIYDMICRVLTEYEEGNYNGDNLYYALCNIQNHWEDIIIAED